MGAHLATVWPCVIANKIDAMGDGLDDRFTELKFEMVSYPGLQVISQPVALFSGKAYENHVINVPYIALYLEYTFNVVVQTIEVYQPEQLGQHGTDVESFSVL